MTTNIYAILDRKSNAVKVGISANPERRLAQLQTASSDKLEMLFTMPGSRAMEKLIHTFLSGKGMALRGEWFQWNADVAGYLLDVWKCKGHVDFTIEVQHERSWKECHKWTGRRHMRLLGLAA